jgi:hypothetical protein
MKRFFAALTLAGLCLAAPTQSFAAPQQGHGRQAVAMFRLRIAGKPDRQATYWVAYGPLNGTFGIIRLHASGNGLYSATNLLPRGHTSLAYIEGHGVIHTPFGPAPGNPVTTIRTINAVALDGTPLPAVQWREPVG